VRNRPPSASGDGHAGIAGVTADDVAAARAVGLTIRLLAAAARQRPTGPIAISVVPTALPADSPLGATDGVRNRIEVDGEPVGRVGFDGPGAGGAATSSAVLGDLLAVAREAGSTWAGQPAAVALPADAVRDGLDGAKAWFVLARGEEAASAARRVAQVAADVPGGLAVRTRPMTLATLRGRLAPIARSGGGAPAWYPVGDA
jgi:homoserine dehydrogenase